MKAHYIAQNVKQNFKGTTAYYLENALKSISADKFSIISAFASKSGVDIISSLISNSLNKNINVHVLVGIDQNGTSEEALKGLLKYAPNAWVFYHPNSSIFHPKAYCISGKNKECIVVGSSNLTSRGLYSNIEASSAVELDFRIEEDFNVSQQFWAEFKELLGGDDPNIQSLSETLIQELVESGLVLPEKIIKEMYNKKTIEEDSISSRLILSFPKRQLTNIPRSLRPLPESAQVALSDLDYKTVWIKKNLRGSDVEMPNSSNSNPTGVLRLTQSGYLNNSRIIDQTTYFREIVFGSLNWIIEHVAPVRKETAIATFVIYVDGTNLGEHDLIVRHKPSGEAGQGNYTTAISWGQIGMILRESDMRGKSLRMQKSQDVTKPFLIEIGDEIS